MGIEKEDSETEKRKKRKGGEQERSEQRERWAEGKERRRELIKMFKMERAANRSLRLFVRELLEVISKGDSDAMAKIVKLFGHDCPLCVFPYRFYQSGAIVFIRFLARVESEAVAGLKLPMRSNTEAYTSTGCCLELELPEDVYPLDFSSSFVLNQLETSCLLSGTGTRC